MLPQMPLPIIHVIGDSHSRLFTDVTGCQVHHIGPKTMFGISKDTAIDGYPLDIRSFGALSGNYVVYVFGEIDVRAHIGRICDLEKKNLETVLNDLVANYIKVVLRDRNQANIIPIISAIVPPSDLGVNPSYPFYSSLEDRTMIKQLLNNKLSLACHKDKILFLDYTQYYKLPDGSLNHQFSDGHVHIEPKFCQLAGLELYRLIKHHKTCVL